MKSINGTNLLLSLMILFTWSGVMSGQNTATTTTTAVQNPDGTYTVVEYPVGKEVTVNLTPAGTLNGATGTATVLRAANVSTIKLNLTGLPSDMSNVNVYAVDPSGKVTLLGPATVNNGVAKQAFVSPLYRFMLAISPESDLMIYTPQTNVLFRSAVPQGFAVVPLASYGVRDGAPIGERIAATSTAGATPNYNVPMLGIPNFHRGTDTHLRAYSSRLADSRVNIFLEPRLDGPTQIKLRFHSLKKVPANTRLVLWAVTPDNTFVRLGQVVNTGERNEAQIQTETNLQDFGLLVTMEYDEEATHPSGQVYATIGKETQEVGSVWATVTSDPEHLKVRYCRYPHHGPWKETTTNAHIQLGTGAMYRFIITDREGKEHVQDVDCSTNCEVKFDF
jgi:hypothetical protein